MTNRMPLLLLGLALAGLLVVGFYGWIRQGPELLLTLAESGLSWCF